MHHAQLRAELRRGAGLINGPQHPLPEALPYREEEIEAIKKKLDDLSSMTDEDIDTMAALLKTLRDASPAPSAGKEETPAIHSGKN